MRIALALLLLAVTAQAQVARRVQGDGLVAWWALEGNAVSVVPAPTGTLGVATSFTRGPLGLAVDNATKTSTRVISVAATNYGTTHTVAAWVRPVAQGDLYNYGAVLGDANTLNAGPLSFNTTTSLTFSYTIGTGAAAVVIPSSLLSNWFHACTVRVGTAVSFYVNGRFVGSGTLPNNNDFVLRNIGGRHATDVLTYVGLYDDLRIYNRALSPQEIAALVNSRRRNHSQ